MSHEQFPAGIPGLPIPSSFPTPDEIKRDARALADRIFSHWHDLNSILQRHEALIRKRWLKKTRDQKKAILLNAWGDEISDCHRPDLQLFIGGPKTRNPNPLDAYKWPYINLEDLLKPKALLIFLNSRGRNPPHAFCHTDLDACRLGIVTQKIDRAFLNEYSMIFMGRDTPEKYGELVSWDDDGDAFDWMTTGVEPQPGDGLLLLEIQERIWKFLASCAKEILHDIPIESINETPVEPEPPQLSIDESGTVTLAATTLEAPYRTPAHLDVTRLKAIIAAKRSAAADHIWALREDPGYFADYVTEWKEHQPEMLLDVHGKKHAIHKSGLTPAFWNRVIKKVINESYMALALWDAVYHRVCKLETLKNNHPDPDVHKGLPEEMQKAFKNLRLVLEKSSQASIALLKSHVPSSPPMRNHWHRENMTSDPHSTKFRIALNSRTGEDSSVERLFWAYTTLWDDQQCFLAGLHTLVNEIDRLTYNDTKAKELQSGLVIDTIGDLAVTSECLNQLSLYHPWSKTIEHKMEVDAEYLADEFRKDTSEWEKFIKMQWQGIDLAGLGTPTEGRFSYPVNRRRTSSNVAAMRKAEHNLDAFWAAVDKHFASQSAHLPDEMMRVLLSGNRSLQRTPEWEEPVKSGGKSTSANLHSIYIPLAETYLQLRPQKRRESTSTLPIRSKLKTRGTPAVTETEAAAAPPGEQLDVQPTFTVDKRAKKVFSTCFFTPSQNDASGEISWADFLHAMQSTGFTPEKLYGSVWQFSPTKLDVERSIQFHEPHPVSKISFHVARRFGRRLTRAYGWHGDMFILQS